MFDKKEILIIRAMLEEEIVIASQVEIREFLREGASVVTQYRDTLESMAIKTDNMVTA